MSHRRLRRVAAVTVVVAGLVPAGRAESGPCWHPPVDAPIADPFRPPPCPWCPGNRGIEYATRPGTPVRAVAAGVVSFAGSVAGRSYVVVRHGDGRRATYGDLAERRVDRGERIVAGSIVGLSTETVHFGLRDGDEYVDPAPFLGRLVGRPRLIPIDGRSANPAPPPRLTCDRAVRRPPFVRRQPAATPNGADSILRRITGR